MIGHHEMAQVFKDKVLLSKRFVLKMTILCEGN